MIGAFSPCVCFLYNGRMYYHLLFHVKHSKQSLLIIVSRETMFFLVAFDATLLRPLCYVQNHGIMFRLNQILYLINVYR